VQVDGEGAKFDVSQHDRIGDDTDDRFLPFHLDVAEFDFELPDVGQPRSQAWRQWPLGSHVLAEVAQHAGQFAEVVAEVSGEIADAERELAGTGEFEPRTHASGDVEAGFEAVPGGVEGGLRFASGFPGVLPAPREPQRQLGREHDGASGNGEAPAERVDRGQDVDDTGSYAAHAPSILVPVMETRSPGCRIWSNGARR